MDHASSESFVKVDSSRIGKLGRYKLLNFQRFGHPLNLQWSECEQSGTQTVDRTVKATDDEPPGRFETAGLFSSNLDGTGWFCVNLECVCVELAWLASLCTSGCQLNVSCQAKQFLFDGFCQAEHLRASFWRSLRV